MPIPRFNPGNPDVNLTAIKSFQPTGAAAEADMWNEMSREFNKVANTFGQIETRRVMVEQERQGMIAGAGATFDPNTLNNVVTAADMAYRKGAVASHLAALDIDKNNNFTAINAESFEDPAMLQKRMQAYVEATAAKMPLDLAVQYTQGAMREVGAYYSNSISAAAGKARNQQKDDIKAGIELSERRLKEIGVPTTTAAQADLEQEAAKLKVKQQQALEAGVMTPNEILVREQVLRTDLEDGTIYQAIQEQPNNQRLNFAINVFNGTSGTGLDLLPPDRRIRAVQVAQQIANAEDAQQRINEMAQTRQAEDKIWKASELISNNPRDPRGAQVIPELLTLANTPETIEQVDKLKNFIRNPDDLRFTQSDPAYMEYLELEAARGKLNQRSIDNAWGSESGKTRISTIDRQKLSRLVQVRPKAIMETNAWDTFVSRVEQRFPVRERVKTGLAGLMLQNGYKDPDDNVVTLNGLTTGEMRANETLVKQIFLETQEKISKGEIASENLLTEYGNKRLAELQSYYEIKKIKPVPASQQGAYVVMQASPTMQQLKNKYKADRQAFARDAASGLLTKEQINTIYRMMQGEK